MKPKQILFFRAHQIAKDTKVSMSIALKKSWAILKLANRMKSETVEFVYKKVDGSIRLAKGTLNVDYQSKGTDRPFNTGIQTYFDIEVNSFRCFKVNNFISLTN